MSCSGPCVSPETTPSLTPPAEWAAHPHFPSQALLLGSHRNFRRVSAALIQMAAEQEPGWRAACMSLFWRWQAAMGGHEGYEEGKLYPYLALRFGVDLTGLEAGHEGLHTLADAVYVALADGSDAAVGLAFADYDAALQAHLQEEEGIVIPLLLAMSPEEFLWYSEGRIDGLLADVQACA